MADVTFEGLRVCQEIALLGSFSAAARSLGYSQPAISRQVTALESALGHRLFVREVRGVSLTPAGSLVVEHAARILSGVTALRLDVDSLGDRLAGRVAVGAFPAAMSVLVPHAVAGLGVDHPGLHINLVEASTPTLVRDVRSARTDLVVIGVGAGLPDYDLDGLTVHRVFAGDLCVAVPEGHRLSASGSVPVAELVEEPWISGTGSAGDPQFAAWPTLTDPSSGSASGAGRPGSGWWRRGWVSAFSPNWPPARSRPVSRSSAWMIRHGWAGTHWPCARRTPPRRYRR